MRRVVLRPTVFAVIVATADAWGHVGHGASLGHVAWSACLTFLLALLFGAYVAVTRATVTVTAVFDSPHPN